MIATAAAAVASAWRTILVPVVPLQCLFVIGKPCVAQPPFPFNVAMLDPQFVRLRQTLSNVLNSQLTPRIRCVLFHNIARWELALEPQK